MKKVIGTLAAILAVALGAFLAGAAPAHASAGGIVWESVPDWDAKTAADLRAQGYVVHTPAEWAALKAYTPCPPRPPAGTTEYFCLWNGYSYSGSRWAIPASWLQDTNGVNAINGLSFYGSGINNASKSWQNNTYYDVRLFDNDSCQNSGWYRNLSAGGVAVQDGPGDADWENRISSISTIWDAGTYCFSTPGT